MAKDEKATEAVTMSVEALAALIDAKVEAGIARAQAGAMAKRDDFAETMRTIRGGDTPSAPITYEECISPLTGASFRAKIMASRTSPLGRVIDLENYTWPAGIDVPQTRGGLMPDEYAPVIAAPEAPASSALKTKYDHWKYWDFLRRDMAEFASGKVFSAYIRKSEHESRRAAQEAAEMAAIAMQAA